MLLPWPFAVAYSFPFISSQLLYLCRLPLKLACVIIVTLWGVQCCDKYHFSLRHKRQVRTCSSVLIWRYVVQSTCHRSVRLHVSYKIPQPCCPHTFHTPTPHPPRDTSQHTHASSRHWCLIDTSLFIVTYPLCQLTWLSVSLCIYGLPVRLISVIRVYVLIGVNTKMGVAGEHFTPRL